MVQKYVSFRLGEKELKDFKGRCKNEGTTYYSVLQSLARKYTNGTLKLAAQDDKIQELNAEISNLKTLHKHKINSLKELNHELTEKCESMSISNKNTYRLTKRIFNYALERNSKKSAQELSQEEINLALKVVHGVD